MAFTLFIEDPATASHSVSGLAVASSGLPGMTGDFGLPEFNEVINKAILIMAKTILHGTMLPIIPIFYQYIFR
jgi:hypothetical protein